MNNYMSTRTAYGETLLELAKEGVQVIALSADTSKSMGIDILKREFPEYCFDVGIAEQNMMAIAAGIASTNKIVFASTYSVFSSMRTCEQIRTFIAYPKLNVKIVSGLGGFSAGIEGVTHIANEDIGIMRCIPNLCIICPSDAIATKKAIREAINHDGPVYVRIGRDVSPVICDETYELKLGKGNILFNDGSDLALMTSGLITYEVLRAARNLSENGIACKVVELPSIKPIDDKLIVNIAENVGAVLTVEEHSIIGGLGSAVSEVLSERVTVRFKRLGVPDCFTETGTPKELIQKYGISAEKIAEEAMRFLANVTQ